MSKKWWFSWSDLRESIKRIVRPLIAGGIVGGFDAAEKLYSTGAVNLAQLEATFVLGFKVALISGALEAGKRLATDTKASQKQE